jgi:hypothetical protein
MGGDDEGSFHASPCDFAGLCCGVANRSPGLHVWRGLENLQGFRSFINCGGRRGRLHIIKGSRSLGIFNHPATMGHVGAISWCSRNMGTGAVGEFIEFHPPVQSAISAGSSDRR